MQVAAPVVDHHVPCDRGHEDEAQHPSDGGDSGGDQDDGVAEEVSHRQPRARPEQHAREVVEREAQSRDREHAGERWHDRGQSGEELRRQHAPCAVTGEDALGAAHARVRLAGQLAKSRQHPSPATAAKLIPREVRGQGRNANRPEHQGDADAALGGQGPDRE
jgi:hypothetical protein